MASYACLKKKPKNPRSTSNCARSTLRCAAPCRGVKTPHDVESQRSYGATVTSRAETGRQEDSVKLAIETRVGLRDARAMRSTSKLLNLLGGGCDTRSNVCTHKGCDSESLSMMLQRHGIDDRAISADAVLEWDMTGPISVMSAALARGLWLSDFTYRDMFDTSCSSVAYDCNSLRMKPANPDMVVIVPGDDGPISDSENDCVALISDCVGLLGAVTLAPRHDIAAGRHRLGAMRGEVFTKTLAGAIELLINIYTKSDLRGYARVHQLVGYHRVCSVVSHSDEGGVVRDLWRVGSLSKPRGIVAIHSSDVINSMKGIESSRMLRETVDRHMLQSAALSHCSDEGESVGKRWRPSYLPIRSGDQEVGERVLSVDERIGIFTSLVDKWAPRYIESLCTHFGGTNNGGLEWLFTEAVRQAKWQHNRHFISAEWPFYWVEPTGVLSLGDSVLTPVADARYVQAWPGEDATEYGPTVCSETFDLGSGRWAARIAGGSLRQHLAIQHLWASGGSGFNTVSLMTLEGTTLMSPRISQGPGGVNLCGASLPMLMWRKANCMLTYPSECLTWGGDSLLLVRPEGRCSADEGVGATDKVRDILTARMSLTTTEVAFKFYVGERVRTSRTLSATIRNLEDSREFRMRNDELLKLTSSKKKGANLTIGQTLYSDLTLMLSETESGLTLHSGYKAGTSPGGVHVRHVETQVEPDGTEAVRESIREEECAQAPDDVIGVRSVGSDAEAVRSSRRASSETVVKTQREATQSRTVIVDKPTKVSGLSTIGEGDEDESSGSSDSSGETVRSVEKHNTAMAVSSKMPQCRPDDVVPTARATPTSSIKQETISEVGPKATGSAPTTPVRTPRRRDAPNKLSPSQRWLHPRSDSKAKDRGARYSSGERVARTLEPSFAIGYGDQSRRQYGIPVPGGVRAHGNVPANAQSYATGGKGGRPRARDASSEADLAQRDHVRRPEC